MKEQWKGFKPGKWMDEISIEEFMQLNYHPYEGDDSFLAGPTERTTVVANKVQELLKEERKHDGVLKVDASRIMTATAFPPGYIDKERDIIVGLQTSRSKEESAPLAEFVWQDNQRKLTAKSWMTESKKFSNTLQPIMTVYSAFTPMK